MHNIQYVDTINIINYLKVLQHVSDHRDPSSGSFVQCLAKNYKNDAIVSVDMDKVDVMAAYSDPLCVCVVRSAFIYSELHTRTAGGIRCHNTEYVHVNGHDRTITVILVKHCTRLPDDGSSAIRNMLEYF